jgi:hypothetical protein
MNANDCLHKSKTSRQDPKTRRDQKFSALRFQNLRRLRNLQMIFSVFIRVDSPYSRAPNLRCPLGLELAFTIPTLPFSTGAAAP